jgi:hypothetical protein
MSVLFSFIGPITEIALFPKYDVSLVQNKACYILRQRFAHSNLGLLREIRIESGRRRGASSEQ